MQVHNTKEKQTIFALNHWVTGNQADLGIGNNPAGNPDWTFTKSAGKYTTKRLRVLILPAK
jgi:sialate O-acetylesterase